MVYCAKCKKENKTESDVCEYCEASLLPGENIQDRIGNLAVGILGGIIAGGISYFLFTHPEISETSELCLLTSPAAWLFAAVAVPVSSVALALRRTPEFTKYENRAKRHKDLDPEQAVADFSKALEMAPEKEKARLLKERGALYEKLGREEDAVRDKLAYTSAEGAYADQSNLARMFGADKDAYASSAIKGERKQLLAQGKIKAVGFCKKCGHVVELNERLSCPLHKKPKPQQIQYVMPSEVDAGIAQVEKEMQAALPKKRRTKNIILVIALLVILLCVILPVVVSMIQN